MASMGPKLKLKKVSLVLAFGESLLVNIVLYCFILYDSHNDAPENHPNCGIWRVLPYSPPTATHIEVTSVGEYSLIRSHP